jgi:hypothetical protein
MRRREFIALLDGAALAWPRGRRHSGGSVALACASSRLSFSSSASTRTSTYFKRVEIGHYGDGHLNVEARHAWKSLASYLA